VFYSAIKYGCYFYLPRKLYERKYTVRTERTRMDLISYAPELLPIFYSAITHGDRSFIS